jgi:hypothetical protein
MGRFTSTPYLILFVILGSVGFGTASAIITITLAGDVNVEGILGIGINDGTNDDTIKFDDGTKSLRWDNAQSAFVFNDDRLYVGTDVGTDADFLCMDGIGCTEFLVWDDAETQFQFSDAVVTNGVIQAGNHGADVAYNRIGTGTTTHGLPGNDDLLISGSLEVDSISIFDDTLSIVASLTPLNVERIGTDGELIRFAQDGAGEGSISVSGTTVSYNAFTGSHYAWTDDTIESGMLVFMTGNNRNLNNNPNSEILYGIEPTMTKNDPAVLGSFLALLESGLAPSATNPHLVMAEGNGEVWVAYTGHDIKPGDYLISSSVIGHAMKDDRSEEISHIIGRAAEPILWDEVSDTIDGVKHKKISILFNSFALNNQIVD